MSRRNYENHYENWITDVRRRLAERRDRKPETKGGQIWAVWPEIKAALADGQSIKSIRLWLEEEGGVIVTPGSLRSNVRRCRRKEDGRRTAETAAAAPGQAIFSKLSTPMVPLLAAPPQSVVLPRTTPEARAQSSLADDPMAIAREALNKPRFDIRKIHNDGDPTGQNLI
jgi:hypothetical protein